MTHDSEGATLGGAMTFVDHIMPFTLVTIDWCLNRMRLTKSFLCFNLLLALFYGMINNIITKVTRDPIYPPFIAWDTPLHWIIGFMLIPWFALYFFIQFWLTECKMGKVTTSI